MKTPLLWDPDSRPDFLGSSESRGPTKSLTRGRLPSSSATFLASGRSFLPDGTRCPWSSGRDRASHLPEAEERSGLCEPTSGSSKGRPLPSSEFC